jgi:hypothetical protein
MTILSIILYIIRNRKNIFMNVLLIEVIIFLVLNAIYISNLRKTDHYALDTLASFGYNFCINIYTTSLIFQNSMQ